MGHRNKTTLGRRCQTRAAPSCDMFNLGSSYLHVLLTTLRHLLKCSSLHSHPGRHYNVYPVWLGSRVVACWTKLQKAWVQIAVATLSGNSLRQTVHTHCASAHQAAKLVAALLRVARVTAGLAESNGSLPPGRWRGTVVERRSLAGELSLSCARPAADG